MNTRLNHHQQKQLIDYILSKYETFAPQKIGEKLSFDRLENSSDLKLFGPKTTLPFKKILFPNKNPISNLNPTRKIALVGLNNCDVWALHIFLDNFKHSKLLPPRENILIVSNECQPDENCFCELWGRDQFHQFDLHLQEEHESISVFAKTPAGNKILSTLGIKPVGKTPVLRPIYDGKNELFDKNRILANIDQKTKYIELWNHLADHCFGCGACTAVCPLCFCTRQEPVNNSDGSTTQCLNWDTCFSKRFSEIQNHYDLRPQNSDRFYNWYHHKFVRAPKENGEILCVGCGRCIQACPAHLNIKNILNKITQLDEEE